ncbi:MAG: hypothetical protein ABSE15_02055 [Candidatus Bathyarchaeia archaeon]|jgi:hypothetical protein
MKRYEAPETLFCKGDLSFAHKILNEPFQLAGYPGRPQRNPLGLFKAHLVRRVKHIPSNRMLVRQMWKDPRLKKIYDNIEYDEPRPLGSMWRGSGTSFGLIENFVSIFSTVQKST